MEKSLEQFVSKNKKGWQKKSLIAFLKNKIETVQIGTLQLIFLCYKKLLV